MKQVTNNICLYLYKINTDNTASKHLTSVKPNIFYFILGRAL